MAARINPERRMRELGIVLPPPCKPAGNYRPARLSGNYLYVSGHTPDDAFPDTYGAKADPKVHVAGKVGESVTTEQAYEAARAVAMAIVSSVKEALGGDLSRVNCLVRATGQVACVPAFKAHPKVMDGFSDFMSLIFGPDNGVGARSATGVISLPDDVPVEVVECVFEVKPLRIQRNSR
jgi:enamine deaminase RidA (YjgF/YER057c/UK114 family)